MKIRKIVTVLLLFVIIVLSAQEQDYIKEIRAFQLELNDKFKNSETSPLIKKDRRKFKGHDFFKINESLRVKGKFTRAENAVPFKMKTTTERAPVYEKFGEVVFVIGNKLHKLNIYQNHRLREIEQYKDHLFLPFTDLTNGFESYEGGRYIDLNIPHSDSIIIDFNKAYNPYCVYDYTRSCPIPPAENDLNIKIEAGVKAFKKSN